jgi:lipoyl(octanoyl) transferase
VQAIWLGQVEYADCWDLQREMADLRVDGVIGDTLLLLEHPPTITLGRGADRANLLASPERLEQLGIAVHEIDRGGDITFHGPGQLVGYPIFNLAEHRKDLHWFLRQIEEALILALAEFGVEGRRFPPHTGVWIGDEKVAAIGIKVSRWVSTHGFAFNVSTSMEHFDLIVPCGIREYGVTSLSRAVGRMVTVEETLSPVIRGFNASFTFPDSPMDDYSEYLSEKSRRIFRAALDSRKIPC